MLAKKTAFSRDPLYNKNGRRREIRATGRIGVVKQASNLKFAARRVNVRVNNACLVLEHARTQPARACNAYSPRRGVASWDFRVVVTSQVITCSEIKVPHNKVAG